MIVITIKKEKGQLVNVSGLNPRGQSSPIQNNQLDNITIICAEVNSCRDRLHTSIVGLLSQADRDIQRWSMIVEQNRKSPV